MTYQEFRKQYPAIRCYREFDAETRANLAWARTGYKARRAVGEFYYVHPRVPGRAFPTAKAATTAAYRQYQEAHPDDAQTADH